MALGGASAPLARHLAQRRIGGCSRQCRRGFRLAPLREARFQRADLLGENLDTPAALTRDPSPVALRAPGNEPARDEADETGEHEGDEQTEIHSLGQRPEADADGVAVRQGEADEKDREHYRHDPRNEPHRVGAPSQLMSALRIQALAKLLAGLEERRLLGLDLNGLAGSRIAAGAGLAVLDRERAEAPQFDPVAARERLGDLVEDRRDDPLHVALIEMWISLGQPGDQFGLCHSGASPIARPCRARYPVGKSFAESGASIGQRHHDRRSGCQTATRPSSISLSEKSVFPPRARASLPMTLLSRLTSRSIDGRSAEMLCSLSSHSRASRSPPVASTSRCVTAARPVKTRPSATARNSPPESPRRSPTISTNIAYI